jgi:two-component system chemotaxis sensor kinase CheA
VDAPTTAGVLVRIQLAKETPLRGVRAFLVVQAIRRLGDVTSVMPPLDVIQRDEFDHDFALRLVTKTPMDEIERVARGAGDVADVQVGEDRPHVATRKATPATAIPTMTTGELPVASRLLAAADEAPITPAPAPGGPAPEPAPVARATSADATLRQQRHVRIDLRRLDSLMNLIGELVITRGRLQQIAGSADDSALTETVTQASRLIGDLRDEIMTSRMVPVWQVFDRFPRLVRDATRALRKQVEFGIEGKEIELDRSMLDEIGDPIVHLLRNAVDHGIESPDERLRAGKPAAGRLVLSAMRDRSAVVIRVTDDGRGIDRDKVLARARTWGLVDAAKTELSDDELLRLVSRPGFSTAEQVTQTSGRGVGVDAVYTRVRSLGGAVDIKSVPGQGTTVTLRLPLTLAIVRALLARVGNEMYAVPLTHVSETVELHPAVRRTLRGKEVLVLREDVLPLLRLRGLVGLPDDEASRPTGRGQLEQVVVVEVADRRAGLVVDELAGQQEIVVKQYDAVRDGLKIFGGATILSDGSPALIVDVSSVC